MHQSSPWVTVAQAVEILGVHQSTIKRGFDRGELNGWRTRGDKGARRIYLDGAARAFKAKHERRRRSLAAKTPPDPAQSEA